MLHSSEHIQEFLKTKRFAMIGVSRDPNDFSRKLFRDFCARRYDVVPVNPHIPLLEGRQCFPSIAEVHPPVPAAILLTPHSTTDGVARECIESGVTLLWIYGIAGARHVSPELLRIAGEHGTRLVEGYCPYMFMSETGFVHRIHGTIWKMIGRYPTQSHC